MPDLEMNGVTGSQFTTTTISSRSTNPASDATVTFDTILDASDTKKTDSTSASDAVRTADLNQIFQKAASTYGVDVDLLKAVARAESNFTANATSSAGAMGIMQLMPATAKSLGVTDAYDPEQNIMAGAKLLASHLNKYNGNVSLALAAYNCGSGAVDRYGGVPPYGETQSYIDKVLSYYNNGVTAPSAASVADVSDPSQMTSAQRKAAAREAAIDRELEEIPSTDLYLTSNVDADLTAAASSSTTTQTQTSASTATTSSGSTSTSSDYQSYAQDYLELLSRLSTSSTTSSSSDADSSLFSSLPNYLTTGTASSYSSTIASLLSSALTDTQE